MVQSLPGFLDLCLDVCSPSQVLGDVYAEVLEAAYSLHRGPTDHKRSVGQQVSLSEVQKETSERVKFWRLPGFRNKTRPIATQN